MIATLLINAVTRESEVHRVDPAENSATNVTADHALRADETQAILRIDGGGIAAAVIAGRPLQSVVTLDSTTTMIGTEKEIILGMIIADDVGVEVLAVHMEAIGEVINRDVATVGTIIAIEVTVEVIIEPAPITLKIILSQRCM